MSCLPRKLSLESRCALSDDQTQITEPQQGPVRQIHPNQKHQQQQKGQKPQRPPAADDDANATREQIRRSIVDIQAALSIQDDVLTQLSVAVHEALEAEGKRHKEVLADVRASNEATAKALETTQQMMRAVMARLNEREKPRTWDGSQVAILVFAGAVLFSVALVWFG